MYRYTIKNQNASSAKYSSCEVCGNPTDGIYYQTEEREFMPNKWTQSGCINLFGHKKCLINSRR